MTQLTYLCHPLERLADFSCGSQTKGAQCPSNSPGDSPQDFEGPKSQFISPAKSNQIKFDWMFSPMCRCIPKDQ